MPKWLKDRGAQLAAKLKIARRRAKRHNRRARSNRRKATHAHQLAEKAERKGQPKRAARAHHRAGAASARAEYHRRHRRKWNRRQEALDLKWNKYLREKREWQKKNPPQGTDGRLDKWGDREVADGFAEILKKSQDRGWDGYVTSGFRSPAYSQQLCYGMCGAPSCPGRCAGTASNHSRYSVATGGAVDVTDYYEFGDIQDEIDVPIRVFNGLGLRDPVHFSRSGN